MLRDHPLAKTKDYLLSLELARNFDEFQTEDAVNETLLAFRNRGPEDKANLARWLNRHKRYDDTLALLDADLALQRRELFLIRMDALAASGRWEMVLDILEQPGLPIEEVIQNVFKARALKALGRPNEADRQWDIALRTQQEKPAGLAWAANYAARIGLTDRAREAYQRMLSHPDLALRGYTGLLQLATRQGDTRERLKLLRKMNQRYPDEDSVQNELNYLSLLLGENSQQALDSARKLLETNPAMFAYRVTYALGALLGGDKETALQLTELQQNANWESKTLKTSWLAIRLIILLENDRPQEAKKLIHILNQRQKNSVGDKLAPEEATMIQEAINQWQKQQ